jgi:hypothetical protein
LITDRKTWKVIGCHVIGERAVDIVEVRRSPSPPVCASTIWLRYRWPIRPTAGSWLVLQ